MTHSELIEMIGWGFCTLVAIFILLVVVAFKYNPGPDQEDESDVRNW